MEKRAIIEEGRTPPEGGRCAASSCPAAGAPDRAYHAARGPEVLTHGWVDHVTASHVAAKRAEALGRGWDDHATIRLDEAVAGKVDAPKA